MTHRVLLAILIFNNSGGAQNAETPPEVAGDKDIQAQLWDYYDKLIQGTQHVALTVHRSLIGEENPLPM
ncbi:hypothetical protein PRIPAC_96994 [Pristionchus pacificus]|uniref:Uncharacterized protein n=1 Tax=Pristionchus pacificus TaxID=54126 RepID=A0A2A6CTX6_PRIPA|nr:hypothetical protein PRIPAC_96994 [Pristionchus pacificus]|eukprot:PDM81684.1 hypothetical protein PRIPAC_30665 [Pristionchus pacificus]